MDTQQLAVGAIFMFLILISSSSRSSSQQDTCLSQRCGDIVVSYPFALSNRPDCPLFSPFFQLLCDAPTNKLLFNNLTINNATLFPPLRVIAITNDSLVVDVTTLHASCSADSNCSSTISDLQLPIFPGPFFISDDNLFGTFGLSIGSFATANFTPASPEQAAAPKDVYYTGYDYSDVEIGGCGVVCPDDENNRDCGGGTCCVVPLASNTYSRFVVLVVAQSPFGTSSSSSNSTQACSTTGTRYATLFHPKYTDFKTGSYGLKLNWALPSNKTDNLAELVQSPDYACSFNSTFTIVLGVPGYLCSCGTGYTGDGYSKGSPCQDIDECQHDQANDCVSGSTCNNIYGSYTCTCNGRFYVGDGRKSGNGCHLSNSVKLGFSISGAIVGFFLIIGSLVFIAIRWKERTKRKYFMQNGGLQLQELLGARSGKEPIRIFKEEELKAATNNYAEHMKLGTGGFGTVYKGKLADGRIVAIKKAKNMGGKDGADREQFLNEMAILAQINHRHIVRLLGCCLERVVPLLVYEYVSNGNVSENLEAKSGAGIVVMGWQQRLKVAQQTAEALAYLHAAASPPILHRDVKSANVLLDENFDAKVADFGTSRLVPSGADQVVSVVEGTLGYLDPEYFQTLQLSAKSDVYSLGVMLIELITGLKPIDSHNRDPPFTNLVLLFIHRVRESKLVDLIDARLIRKPSNDSSIMAVAALANRCLALDGSARPSMSEVADELRHICHSFQASGNEEDDNEDAPLLPASKQKLEDHDVEVGAVMPQEGAYYVLQSGSIVDLLHKGPTLPR